MLNEKSDADATTLSGSGFQVPKEMQPRINVKVGFMEFKTVISGSRIRDKPVLQFPAPCLNKQVL